MNNNSQKLNQKTIDRAALHLLQTEGFMARYETLCIQHPRIKLSEVYELTEAEHVAAFEFRRYRNEHNFRKSYNQFISRKKRKYYEKNAKILRRRDSNLRS